MANKPLKVLVRFSTFCLLETISFNFVANLCNAAIKLNKPFPAFLTCSL